MRQSVSKAQFALGLESLTGIAPFILALDASMTVTWASEAILKRVECAMGMELSELVKFGESYERLCPDLLSSKVGQLCELTLVSDGSAVPLAGWWLRCDDGFILLATPDAKTTEDLEHFRFDDFPANDHLVDSLVVREENNKSLKEAALASDVLKRRNEELAHSKQQMEQKLHKIDDQRRAILNMLKDIEKSKQQLESANAALESEIAERKQAELKQIKLLKELENVNKELKDFAYITSHDLKAPLRGISTLAEWISTDYADKLDEQGKEQLNLLLARTKRMHNLIEGILQYSRVGRTKEEMVQVNLNELVPEIIDTLAPPQNIEITIENELPVIESEETRIIQVFQNLLSNAIKYMDKPEGRIKIGCVEEDSFWKFSVADNGPGIEEKYFGKIFQIFQTLLSRDEFESTGVGLTVVKKIIESYDGRIWVQSKPGQGSTFFFTLPKQEMGVKNAKLKANIAY